MSHITVRGFGWVTAYCVGYSFPRLGLTCDLISAALVAAWLAKTELSVAGQIDAMSRPSRNTGAERNQTSGSALSVLEAQRKQRGLLRRWLRCLDKISEGAHVWPASALLTLGILTMVVVWLCRMSTHNSSSLYLALKIETDLHDVITALQRERQCTAYTCLTSSSLR